MQVIELTPELRAAITEVYDLAEQNMDHHYCGMCGECSQCHACKLVQPLTNYAEDAAGSCDAHDQNFSAKWNGLMPRRLFDWLVEQSSKTKDEIWEWADSYSNVACQIIEVVGTENGSSNEEDEINACHDCKKVLKQ